MSHGAKIKQCRHCGRQKHIQARGLCDTCYYGLPEKTRSSYPTRAEEGDKWWCFCDTPKRSASNRDECRACRRWINPRTIHPEDR